jgi:ribosomal protein L29
MKKFLKTHFFVVVSLLSAFALLQQGCSSQAGISGMKGGGLGNIASIVQSVTGESNAKQMADMEINNINNSLQQLNQELSFVQSFQAGRQIYDNLNNVITSLTGQNTFAQLTTQYPSVNVVREQIAAIKSFIAEQKQFFDNMTTEQLQQFVQKLQQANTQISSATSGAMAGGMGMGMGMGMGGMGMMGGTGSLAQGAGMMAGAALGNYAARRL